VFWFTHNPATVYRAVLMINAAVSVGLMPLAISAFEMATGQIWRLVLDS
jgi:hypothetical protein